MPAVRGCRTTSCPTTGPGPVTRFTAPLGTPAASQHSMSLIAQTDVVGAGTQTTVLPMANAGARLQSTGMFIGKFHGVMIP